MIGSTRSVRVWTYASPADLRRGYDRLSCLVREGLGHDPLSGNCYLFVNRIVARQYPIRHEIIVADRIICELILQKL